MTMFQVTVKFYCMILSKHHDICEYYYYSSASSSSIAIYQALSAFSSKFNYTNLERCMPFVVGSKIVLEVETIPF